MIVADTGAVIALMDRKDAHHEALKSLYDASASEWVLPWAILPEVDYLLLSQLGLDAEEAFLDDLAAGHFVVEWSDENDLFEARQICERHRALKLGLVDATVIAIAERTRARAIATLDLRHFGAVRISGNPRLLPRDSLD